MFHMSMFEKYIFIKWEILGRYSGIAPEDLMWYDWAQWISEEEVKGWASALERWCTLFALREKDHTV